MNQPQKCLHRLLVRIAVKQYSPRTKGTHTLAREQSGIYIPFNISRLIVSRRILNGLMVNMIQSIRMDLSLMSMFGIIDVYQLSIVINVLIVRKVECQFCCKNQIMCFLGIQ